MTESRPTSAGTPAETLAVGLCVGNTRTQVGLLTRGGVEGFAGFANSDLDRLLAHARDAAGDADLPIVVASVNPPLAEELSAALGDRLRVLRVGRDAPVPIVNTLDDDSTVGQDRLLCALGAFRRFGTACVVIDAGTAITADFVDGEGTFHGGAIGPGLGMMLRAMHEHTAALPSLTYAPPDAARGCLGKDTAHAMILGVRAAAVGMAHHLIDRYAEFYEAYPTVVATGGDAATLFEGDELVEHLIPELQLLGLSEACARLVDDPDAGSDPA